MSETFANLPSTIATSISTLLSHQEKRWIKNAEELHSRYMNRLPEDQAYLQSPEDSLAYLGLRVPATYAQIVSVLSQVKEVLPSFTPTSLLDIGSGPGVGAWAAHEVWPTLKEAICIDQDKKIITLGERINRESASPLKISWLHNDIRRVKKLPRTDLIIVANVLNELSSPDKDSLIPSLEELDNPIIVIIEPGNPNGVEIIQAVSRTVNKTHSLLAPYINASYVASSSYWIHFSQRFIRPDFTRLLRQFMRESEKMASDWEETKYAYIAFAKNMHQIKAWGRCIGHIKKQKGVLEIPILTDQEVCFSKVLKRHKKEYSYAKKLKWGDLIMKKEDIIHNRDL